MANDQVNDMYIDNDDIYICGKFTIVGGDENQGNSNGYKSYYVAKYNIQNHTYVTWKFLRNYDN